MGKNKVKDTYAIESPFSSSQQITAMETQEHWLDVIKYLETKCNETNYQTKCLNMLMLECWYYLFCVCFDKPEKTNDDLYCQKLLNRCLNMDVCILDNPKINNSEKALYMAYSGFILTVIPTGCISANEYEGYQRLKLALDLSSDNSIIVMLAAKSRNCFMGKPMLLSQWNSISWGKNAVDQYLLSLGEFKKAPA